MNKEIVYKNTFDYFKGDTLATNVWIDKYCLKNGEDYLESSPDDMHRRLVKEFARIEQKYPNPLSEEEIYYLLSQWIVIPGGSILYGAGNPYSISSLGNCFVIGNKADSYGGILQIDQEQIQLMKRRGGVGHDLSHIRPKSSIVTNAAGSSTGVVPFMERYSNSTREVAQDGRRGALMLSININHPDSLDFIEAKNDLTKITGANISVKINDAFMQAVENDDWHYLYFGNVSLPLDEISQEDLDSISEGKIVTWANCLITKVKAKELWNKLIHQAWKSAEPGVLFWDNITNESIPSCYGEEWKETSTNPCGEIPLCPYDSCRLMSVNLYSFVENPFTDKAYFNYDKFKDVAYKAQRLMDDVVDLEEEKINLILNKIENDPEPDKIKSVEKNLWFKIKLKLLDGRRTGLSAIGLADMFASMHHVYGDASSITLAEEIYKQFAISAYKSSIDMARERGAFPIFNSYKEKENPFIQRIQQELGKTVEILDPKDRKVIDRSELLSFKRRNIALLTIPPSGSLAILAGISSGIEPVFNLHYTRRRKVDKDQPHTYVDKTGDCWEEYIVLHPKFKEWMSVNDKHCLLPDYKSIESDGLIEISPYYKSTAYEIDPINRVRLQARIQRWVDHSISSTINLSEDTTEQTVSNIYTEAWREGLKGITIYRNNCRTGVLVDMDKKDNEFKQHDAPKRPKILPADIYITKSKGKEFLIIVGIFDKNPYEIFAIENRWNIKHSFLLGDIIKRSKGIYDLNIKDDLYIENVLEDISDEENNLSRMISTALRHGSNVKFIVEQLNKSRGDITSFAKAISRILKRYIKDGVESKDVCPQCGSKMVYQNGCKECSRELNPECTYSKC